MNSPCHWALALVKANREPHEAKKTSFDLGGNRTHDLYIRSTVALPNYLQGTILDGESRRRKSKGTGKGYRECKGSLFPFNRANAQ